MYLKCYAESAGIVVQLHKREPIKCCSNIMKNLSLKIVKRLFALSGNQCAFPNCISPMVNAQGVIIGEICHIKAKNAEGPRFESGQSDEERNDYENLILLCRSHHKIIDDQPDNYDVTSLLMMKKIHEENRKPLSSEEAEHYAKLVMSESKISIQNTTGPIIINSPGSIQAGSLTIKTEKKNLKMQPPSDAIGSNIKYRGYAKHLIDRYQYYAGSDPTRKYKFHYQTIYNSIKKEFGVKWDWVPVNNFERLVIFLHKKVNQTRMARINKGKGFKSYSSFEEYCSEKFKTNKH